MSNIDMKLIEDLEKRSCKELDKLYEKKDWGPAEINMLYQLTGAVKNALKIQEHAGGYAMNNGPMNGYAQGGRWTAHGAMEGEYGHNDGYSGRRHWVKGHYSRESMPSSGSGGDYTNHGGGYARELEKMAENATGREREALKRWARELRNA